MMGITKRFNGTQLEQELTKPCPLMPDGEWNHYRIDLTISSDGETVTPIYYYNGSTTSDSRINLSVLKSTGNIYMELLNSSRLKFAECRMCLQFLDGSPSGNFGLQGTYGWQVLANKAQRYCAISNTTDFAKFNGTHTVWDFYCYFIPQE